MARKNEARGEDGLTTTERRQERQEEKARREARRLGYEYRPTAVRDGEYARRLEAGFRMLGSN